MTQRPSLHELFHQALQFGDSQDRQAFLEIECQEYPDLLWEVQQLLAAHERSSGPLDRPLSLSSAEFSDSAVELPGEVVPPGSAGTDESTLWRDSPAAQHRNIGKYLIRRELGRGGMGVVWEAFDPDLKRPVAIKVPSPLNQLSSAAAARFKAEARAVARLDFHANIVRIHHVELDHDPPFIVMELLAGRDLAQWVRQEGPLELTQALRFIRDAACGLDSAHRAGIIHRDVKPQNLLITDQGQLKVLDLGLAKLPVSRERHTTEIINSRTDSQGGGSVEFISPEQSQALAQATPQSDIYSLGCTLYYLVTGRVPFAGGDREEILAAHRSAPRPRLAEAGSRDSLTNAADEMLQRLMAIDPAQRPAGMAEVVADIEALLDQQAIRRRRRHRQRLGVGGVIAAGLAIWALIWAFSPPRYNFDFSQVLDSDEVQLLSSLHEEIRHVQEWNPIAEQLSPTLMGFVQQASAGSSFRQFLRSGGSEWDGQVNRALLTLSKQWPAGVPRQWLSLSTDDLRKQISNSLQTAIEAEQRERLGLLVSKEEWRLLLKRWGVPPYPSAAERQRLWVAELLDSIQQEVQPTARWYQQIRETDRLVWGQADGRQLILKPRANETVFRGRQTQANFEVWVKAPQNSPVKEILGSVADASEAPTTWEWDTGIRLIDCRYMADEQQQLTIAWPPADGVIDQLKLENHLRLLGLPAGFLVRNARLQFDEVALSPAFNVGFEFTHEDLLAVGGQHLWGVDTRQTSWESHDVSRYQLAANQLSGALAALQQYRGFSIQLTASETAGRLKGTLQIPQLPPLPIQATLDQDYRVCVVAEASVSWRDELAKLICDQSESLKGMQAFGDVQKINFDRQQQRWQGHIGFRLDSLVTGTWTLDSQGKLGFFPSADLLQTVRRERELFLEAAPTPLTAADLQKEIVACLSQIPTAAHCQLGSVQVSELGSSFTLGLQIGDWREIRLGPATIRELSEVRVAVERLIQPENILEMSRIAWSETEQHPRFGRSRSRLNDWDPVTAQAAIETTIFLTQYDYPLTLSDQVTWREGAWITRTESELAESLAASLNPFLRLVRDSLRTATGVGIEVQVDDRDGALPWIRWSPPAVTLQAGLVLPLGVATELEFGNIILSQEGISLPNAVVARPRLSIPCGYFTASDPSCQIDFGQNRLSLGAKFTPPFPSGGVAPGDQTSATLAAYGVPPVIGDIRWDNLFLHAGHVAVQIDGQIQKSGVSSRPRYNLGAGGKVILLEDTQLARCRGDVTLQDWEMERLSLQVDGQIQPAGVQLGSLAGRLDVFPTTQDPSGGLMQIEGNALLNGFQLAGKLRYYTLAGLGRVKVNAQTKLPVVGLTRVEGHTDLAFQDYQLEAAGAVPLPPLNYEIHYELNSTPENTHFDWWWVTASGRKVHYATNVPRIDLIDETALLGELQAVVQMSLEEDWPAAADADHNGASGQSAYELATAGSTAEVGKPSVQTMADSGAHPDVDLEFDGDEIVLKFSSPPYGELARIHRNVLGVTDWMAPHLNFWTGWTPADEFEFMVVHCETAETSGRMDTILIKTDGSLKYPAIELNETESQWAREQGAFRLPWDSPYYRLAQGVIVDAVEMRMHGSPTAEFETLSDGYLIRIADGPWGPVAKSYVWDGTKITRLTYAGLSSDQTREAVAKLSRGVPGVEANFRFESFVVAVNGQSDPPYAALLRREGRDRFVLEVTTASGIVPVALLSSDYGTVPRVLEVAQQIAKVVWQGETPPEVTHVGGSNACGVSGDAWWLFAGSEASGVGEIRKLSRERFSQGFANSPAAGVPTRTTSGDELFPSQLRSATARRDLAPDQLTQWCIRPWDELKQEPNPDLRWPVHPWGLLWELAEPER